MSGINFSEELDFGLLFEEYGRHTAGLDVRTLPTSTRDLNEQLPIQDLQHHHTTEQDQHAQGPQYESQDVSQHGTLNVFDCPSIQITSITPNNHMEPGCSQEALVLGGVEGHCPDASGLEGQLYLPQDPCYRDTMLCPSPCSSISSRSWISDVSSSESFSHVNDDVDADLQDAAHLILGSSYGSHQGSPGCGGGALGVELWQQKYQHPLAFSLGLSPHQSPHESPHQSPHHSPCTSATEDSWLNDRPTSRLSSSPSSPCGKRRSPSPHHSPSPTPGSCPRSSVTGDTCVGSPSKTRKTSPNQLALRPSQREPGEEPLLESPAEDRRHRDDLMELFLQVPSHFSWNKPKPGNAPLFRYSSPPPLDWSLPNQFDQYELKLEVQPRSHHRAHYETEGSRGSIKAAHSGHPVVKLMGYNKQPLCLLLFIGTADNKSLRPHPFYQVHRVTSKIGTTTSCQERMIGSTKVLEIPLLPENDMSASIDCAGILKLRNVDIELNKGETDIGRKNTRVRVVFRVAVPQSDDGMLWLQTASVTVECSQRSRLELPLVESFSPSSCSVDGGQDLVIRGSSMSSSSRVIFTETERDGRSLWETEAKVVKEKSKGSRIIVEVPPYNKNTTHIVQVQFYVSNAGKRSELQTFTYLPRVRSPLPAAAQMHWSHNPPGLCSTSCQMTSYHQPDEDYYDSFDFPVPCRPLPALHHSSPSSVSWKTPTMPTQVSPLPPQTFTSLRQREPSISLSSMRRAVISAAPPSESLFSSPEDLQSIKHEPEDPHPIDGLREITLDDVNEVIDRDIGIQPHHYNQYDSKSTGHGGTH